MQESPYLTHQTFLLREIDRIKADIVHSLKTMTHPDAKTWLDNFPFICDKVERQLGWEGRKSRRERWLQILFPFLRTTFLGESVIWSEPQALEGYPLKTVSYPTAYGFRLSSKGLDTWQMMATQHYQSELSETWLFLQLFSQVDVFVDVGANMGFFTLLAAAQSSVRILSCEPSSSTFSRLKEAIAVNRFSDRVQLLNIALGAAPGHADLHARIIGCGGESLLPLIDERTAARERVEVRTLDSVMDTFELGPQRTLIKIDVEGFEHAVFSGAMHWRQSAQPPIFLFESWPNAPVPPATLIRSLIKEGYRIFTILPLSAKGPVIKEWTSASKQGTGNYLAVPPWFKFLGPLRQPVDRRLFSPTQKLENAHIFFKNYLTALQQVSV